MERKDIKAVQELINNYLKQFNLAPVMDEEEVAHWFLPQDHIIDTFVVEVRESLFPASIENVRKAQLHQTKSQSSPSSISPQ